ncbi:sigma-70 family RNA polymerase sigma factor [Nocardioides sp.]|uniref:sigma-70 family RNA polymerase sigma factor n=1 Tax=Nocardioides sp. TaxID=35761 RepID=UPI00261BF69F|nr:sigma-70 family RNA polymerase sigma factor [Nocardioides sp.]
MSIAPLPLRPATPAPASRPSLGRRSGSTVAPPRVTPAPPTPGEGTTTRLYAVDGTAERTTAPVEHDPRRRATSALLVFAHGLPEEVRRPVLARVVDANMPVAEAVAARYRRRGLSSEDLQQAAYEGLCKAVHRFDPAQAEDLLSFAVPTIRGEVQRYFRDHSWVVRPPRRLQELSAQVRALREEVEQELGRPATTAELAERLGVDERTCEEALQASAAMHATSLDAPVGPTGTARISDLLGEGDRLERVDDHLVLRPLIAALGPREQQLLHLRFVEELSQSEIGEVLGVTQTQVSRLLRKLLDDLRRALDARDVLDPRGAVEG